MAIVDSFIPGGGPASFTLASNWSLNSVPTSADDAIISVANGDAIINGTDQTVSGIGTDISDFLRIETAGILTLVNGTDSHENFGNIVLIENSELDHRQRNVRQSRNGPSFRHR